MWLTWLKNMTNIKDHLRSKQTTYKLVFGNEMGKKVLSDLRDFCFATKSTFDSDPQEMARREGRREVFMQIMNIIKVDYASYYDYDDRDPVQDVLDN